MSEPSKGRIPSRGSSQKNMAPTVRAIKRTKEAGKDGDQSTVAKKSSGTSTTEGTKDASAQHKRHPLGVRRLDDLLQGGLDHGTFTLLFGPPYLGKEHLARLCAVQALKADIPVIYIHTDSTVQDLHDELVAIDSAVEDAAKSGLLWHVDCYSRSIEADESRSPYVQYVDGAMDLNGISLALNQAQRKMHGHEQHMVVLDSLSTITAYSNPQTAFRFLQVLLGKSRLVGATCIVLLDAGMHTEAEVQTFRHLTTGSLDVREHNGKFQLKALGLSDQEGLGWIDYRYHHGRLEVTGSFAPGRIR